MLKKILIAVILGLMWAGCSKAPPENELVKNEIKTAQAPLEVPAVCEDIHFNEAFYELKAMLEGQSALDFKRAVFLVEWAYLEGNLDYPTFCRDIDRIAADLQAFVHRKGLGHYKTSGNYALFEFFTKPHPMNGFEPFRYDFEDFYGKEEYQKLFVSKLLETHTGQCRSMPMLYKILSDEIGAESYLALGPNHLYIKHLDEQGKWVNIELTNGHYASDSWMISSMDISAESIRKGVYMKELNQKESVAFCLTELAMAYQHKYRYDSLGLVATDLTLAHFPNCITALMHQANTLTQFGLAYIKEHSRQRSPYLDSNYTAYQALEAQMAALGYREMSADKYAAWVRSMETERAQRMAQTP
jgi:hypothetical protein